MRKTFILLLLVVGSTIASIHTMEQLITQKKPTGTLSKSVAREAIRVSIFDQALIPESGDREQDSTEVNLSQTKQILFWGALFGTAAAAIGIIIVIAFWAIRRISQREAEMLQDFVLVRVSKGKEDYIVRKTV